MMTMTDVPRHDVSDASLAAQGVRRIEWAERSMPVLRQIRERFEKEEPLKGRRFAACMHMTTETAILLRTLKAGGAQLTACASNPLSTQDDTVAALVHEYGISVFARNGVDRDGYYAHINAALDIQPDFVFDDGCDLVNTLHTSRTELLENVKGGCEETTTGVVRLRQMAQANALKFPMIAVNDTNTKRMFDNRYGTGQSSLDAIMRATNLLFAGKSVVIAGFGYCGSGLAQRAAGLGAHVIVTEVDPIKALDAVMQGYRVMPMAEAARIGDVFITVTSNRGVLRKEHFEVMKDGAILANAGHFDVEVDVAGLGELAVQKNSGIRHRTDEYVMPDSRRLYLVAEGRLVNLGAAEGHPASVMDMSFADQALAAEWLTANYPSLDPTVHAVPAELDATVARLKLASMGMEIDAFTADQQHYMSSWEHGS
jgi:adenosylhomocysteinase